MASEGIANFAAFLGAVVPIFGLYLVWQGLSTWKKQGIWQVDSDLARRLLVSLYKYRGSLYSVRQPALYSAEMDFVGEEIAEAEWLSDETKGKIRAYTERWRKHSSFSSELDALLVEADALWGKELRGLVEPIRSLEWELYRYVFLYLDILRERDEEMRKEYIKIKKKKRNILYDSLSEDDVFRVDFQAAEAKVETYLRKHLGRQT